MVKWTGVYSAVLTPFNEDDSIDYNIFRKNLDVQLDAGVDGIVLAGSLGEASTLTPNEKNELLRFTTGHIRKKVPVIMNIAEQATKAAVQAVNNAVNYGADGLMVLPPLRYSSDDFETLEYFKALANASHLPVMIYNNPVDYKILVTLDMFEALSELPNIEAVKESTRDVVNVTRMINRFGDRFKILSGVDPLAIESLMMGANGWVAGLVDAFPRETVAIYRLMKAGYTEEALTIHRWFLPLLELDIQPKLVQYIKLAASVTGISTEFVRAPRLMLTGQERKDVLSVINKALHDRPSLPDYLNLGAAEYSDSAIGDAGN